MSATDTLSPVAVKAERHGGVWFTYDSEGFVIDAGLEVDEARDAVQAGREGLTLAEWQHEEALHVEEMAGALAEVEW